MASTYKVKNFKGQEKKSKWRMYAALVTGSESLGALIRFELITLVCGNLGGALGLFLRSKLYPSLFRRVGRNVNFGRGITLRQPGKIDIGDNVIVDDYCVLDAKGESNEGITLGNDVFLGRNTILYCKNGNINFGDKVNLGVNCVVYAKESVSIGEDTMIAAFCHIMNGGQYDYTSALPFSEQSSYSLAPTVIGKGCWLGSRVVVQDGVEVGSGTVIGSGSIVTRSLPDNVVALGMPAKVKSDIERKPPGASEKESAELG